MSNRKLAEVGARLEESQNNLPDDATPLERYLLYEELAIAILDSEYMDFPEGGLEFYLKVYLAEKRQQLSISEEDLA